MPFNKQRARTARLISALFLLASCVSQAQIVVVGDATRAYSAAFIEHLKEALQGATIRAVDSHQVTRPDETGPPPELIVALGGPALRDVLASARIAPAPASSIPVLAVLVTQDQYTEIVHAAKMTSPPIVTFPVSAIYGDPDPAIQLRLIQATFRRPVSVGLWVSYATSPVLTKLYALAPTLNIKLVVEKVALDGGQVSIAEIARATSAHADVDAWLALPDPAIFSASALKTILSLAYARSQPVFGFTASMVTAGAAASAWVPPDMLAADIASTYRGVVRGAGLPQPRYGRQFAVAVNDSVLRSLGLPVAQTLRQLGRAP